MKWKQRHTIKSNSQQNHAATPKPVDFLQVSEKESEVTATAALWLIIRGGALRALQSAIQSRDGKSVKNSTDEYFSPKIAHKMRISKHVTICAKTA